MQMKMRHVLFVLFAWIWTTSGKLHQSPRDIQICLLLKAVLMCFLGYLCNLSSQYDPNSIFWSQEQLDARLAGCTSINGWLNIAHNFSGTFVLNNISSIVGGIGTVHDASSQSTTLTSIEAHGLQSVQQLSIFHVPMLKNVSFPDLISIGNLNLDLEHDVEIYFPSLTNATAVSISGPVSR